MNEEFKHISVLLNECIDGLNIKPNGIYVDATAGGAGHSKEIAKRINDGRLIAIDRDPDAIDTIKQRLADFSCVTVVQSNYTDIDFVLDNLNIDKVDGVLMDLGVSSFQLDNADRGFSYKYDAPLDMRMSKSGLSAYDIVNTYTKEQLTKIIFAYGEERFASKIAFEIVKQRIIAPIKTTNELTELLSRTIPAASKREKHPARRTFQALRIAVNDELGGLETGLDAAYSRLSINGRLAVITFHSLEDRIVKHKFVEYSKGCTCPPDFPVCNCGKIAKARIVTRKPIEPSEQEVEQNKRSRSARLRIIEKLS